MQTTGNKTIDITQAIIKGTGEEVLNRVQAGLLFDKNAILVRDRDVIEINTAIDLLGKNAVEFAKNLNKEFFYNCYGIGEYQLIYLTKADFFTAVTYRNIDTIRRRREAAGC